MCDIMWVDLMEVYMKINSSTTSNEIDAKIVEGMDSMSSKDIVWSSHATIKDRDESEVMNVINASLKREAEYRTKGEARQQEGSCFDMALKGSKIFLEAQGHVFKKTLDPKRK